jgi:hypothetical protein
VIIKIIKNQNKNILKWSKVLIVLIFLTFLILEAAMFLPFNVKKNKIKSINTPGAAIVDGKSINTFSNTSSNDSKNTESRSATIDSSASGTLTISRAGQSKDGGTVSIRTVVVGISSGICVIKFKMQSQPIVTQNFNIVNLGNYYSCGAVEIPISLFSVNGLWDAQVQVVDSSFKPLTNISTWQGIQVQK